MAGHTSEKRWRRNQNPTAGNVGVSELASQVCVSMITALDQGRQAFNELQELYQFAGGTVQGLADQLFLEDWQSRGVPGMQATITVDVVAGAVENPLVAAAGTGYTNGIGFTMVLAQTAGGGDRTAEVTYDVVGGSVTNPSVSVAGSAYNDGTSITVREMPAPMNSIFETEANAEELAKAQDLFDAITALNELYGAADNQATTAEDRFSQLRRMS